MSNFLDLFILLHGFLPVSNQIHCWQGRLKIVNLQLISGCSNLRVQDVPNQNVLCCLNRREMSKLPLPVFSRTDQNPPESRICCCYWLTVQSILSQKKTGSGLHQLSSIKLKIFQDHGLLRLKAFHTCLFEYHLIHIIDFLIV